MFSSLYSLIFKSNTNPTKFAMGIASISWGLFDLFRSGISTFYVLLVLYGICMIWRVFDYKQRPLIATYIFFLGAILWTYDAWLNLLISDTITSHIVLPIIVAAQSLWLLLRVGTGEIIGKQSSLDYTRISIPYDCTGCIKRYDLDDCVCKMRGCE